MIVKTNPISKASGNAKTSRNNSSCFVSVFFFICIYMKMNFSFATVLIILLIIQMNCRENWIKICFCETWKISGAEIETCKMLNFFLDYNIDFFMFIWYQSLTILSHLSACLYFFLSSTTNLSTLCFLICNISILSIRYLLDFHFEP